MSYLVKYVIFNPQNWKIVWRGSKEPYATIRWEVNTELDERVVRVGFINIMSESVLQVVSVMIETQTYLFMTDVDKPTNTTAESISDFTPRCL